MFGERMFATQKEAEEYVRALIQKIGLRSSVKTYNEDLFCSLLDVLHRHPDSENKLDDMVDISIVRNKLNRNAYEIHIIKTDSVEDISWRQCISGKGKSCYKSALRYSIEDQIQLFKKTNNIDKCTLCGKSTNRKPHVDHIIHFEKLIQDFNSTNGMAIPTQFNESNDGTNRKNFTPEDELYANAWKEYHKNNAQLRILCSKCNLTREHY